MLARNVFEMVKMHIAQASEEQDAKPLIEQMLKLNWKPEGECNYMNFQSSFTASDGSFVRFSYRSYDPSGPFQNLPDINKIKLQLFYNDTLIDCIDECFEDISS